MQNPNNTIIQTEALEQQRMLAQLRAKKVDSGQYFGGGKTAKEWKTWADLHPMRDITSIPLDKEVEGNVCVVDLGPGTGKPCIAAIQSFRHRVSEIVCVDTLPAMLTMAVEHIREETSLTVRGIVANFLQDADALREALDEIPQQKIMLCLGNTAANFNQRYALTMLRSLLDVRDRILLGLGLYSGENPDRELKALGDLFASEANCSFGLRFLEECGGTPDHRQAYSMWEEDAEEPGVMVVRSFFRFPENTVLSVDGDEVAFEEGEELQFIESRRYPKDGMEDYLQRHGLELVSSMDFGNHGLFLCRRSEQ